MTEDPGFPACQPFQSLDIQETTDYARLILRWLRASLPHAPRPGFLELPERDRRFRQPHRVWHIPAPFQYLMCYILAMRRSLNPRHRGERKYPVIVSLT